MKKERFEQPEIEIITFKAEDVIATSLSEPIYEEYELPLIPTKP